IIDIRVNEGQPVKSGDPLIVLKAMKMENVLKSPHDGTIKKILVEKNQKVKKDELILQF
ncbi:MAG: acetyl-CoA carboxylase biotin carboxyl carrier protein subunit, partial [Cyclobacteriaceae bacterium]|nr:acetyl-CoA carboxylase biotin carboxyl carrier protein subunit [Cyclobacteriaceae bacterium]